MVVGDRDEGVFHYTANSVCGRASTNAGWFVTLSVAVAAKCGARRLSRAGMVSSEINAIAVRNFFMTHLLNEVVVFLATTARRMAVCVAATKELGVWNDRKNYISGSIG